VIDDDSRWWWEALHAEGLSLPRCRRCSRFFFPPMAACPHCGGGEHEHVVASGRGTVYSWVVVHRPQHPVFDGEAPYTILTVQLEEGPRIFARLVGDGAVSDGAPVRAARYEAGETTLLGFELEEF
jgi:uncharacterized OB-fold protein